MTSDERKTLEALADDARHLLTTTIEERAAIRSALATVDALTQKVRDLEARAIPKELIEPAMRPDSIDTFYVYLEPDDSEREADRTIMFVCNGRIVTQDYNTVVDYPTVGDALKALSAALRAATEAT